MKNKITVASLNVSQAALLSGKTRETVSRTARELQSVNGAGNAKFYDSRKLLQALYLGVTGPTYSEAQRLLALARRKQIEIDIMIKRKTRIPLDDVESACSLCFRSIAAIIKANCGKFLTVEVINDIFSTMRNTAEKLKKEHGAADPEFFENFELE